jgi:hypothetical protein
VVFHSGPILLQSGKPGVSERKTPDTEIPGTE